MQRIYLKDLKKYTGSEISVCGFVQAIRDQGGIKFLILRDVSGIAQVVVLKSEKETFDSISELSLESVIEVLGSVKEEKQAPEGYEIKAKSIKILSHAKPELPIPVVEKGGDEVDITKRLDYRWLDLRGQDNLKIFKLWTDLERGFRKYFEENNFIQVYTPSLMSTASESGAEVFKVEYFDKTAYLAQSPQFYKQMAMACGFERIFVVGPVFRAEPSYTTRHMTEFTGWDFEISYIKDHFDVMRTEEELLASSFKYLKEKGYDVDIPSIPFPRITIKEAKEKLKGKGITSEKEHDLSPEEEREISKIVKEESGCDFVFITDYHISIRPFYHMRHEDNPELTKSFDLLYKGLEITTGAQREHRIDVLEKQAKEKNMSLEVLEDYLNFFRYGCPPHGGVGIGPARIIMGILNLTSVKEATFLPRDVKRLRP